MSKRGPAMVDADAPAPAPTSEGKVAVAPMGDGNEEGSDSSSSSSSDSSDDDSSSTSEEENDSGEKIVVRFRNYRPFDPSLQELASPPASAAADLVWLDEEVNGVISAARARDDALLDIVPRAADWDLARDAAPRLAVLNARTKRALALLVRDKISKQEAGGASEGAITHAAAGQ